MFAISAVSHAGLRELSFALAELVAEHRAGQQGVEAAPIVLSPAAIDDSGFTVVEDPEVPRGVSSCAAENPERWVRQTQFDNDEAVGYLADRLARLGVEDELARLGAQPGATVTIGDYVFDFAPTGELAKAGPTSRPGVASTSGWTQTGRRGADERLADKRARRMHRTDAELAAEASWAADGSSRRARLPGTQFR